MADGDEDIDTDGLLHGAKMAWRALANLQMILEARAIGLSKDAYIQKLQEDALPPRNSSQGGYGMMEKSLEERVYGTG
jgi:hypothetical protein